MKPAGLSIASVDVSSVVRACDVTSVDAGYTVIKRTTSHQSLCVVLNYLRARDNLAARDCLISDLCLVRECLTARDSLTVRDSLISDLCLVRESQTACDSLSIHDNLTSNLRVYVTVSPFETILSQTYAL